MLVERPSLRSDPIHSGLTVRHRGGRSRRLLAGQEVLRDYSRMDAMHSRFCGVCGVRVFSHGDIPQLGGAFYSVNLNCLDGVDFTGVPVRYLDGRHDTWAELARASYVSPFTPAAHARA